jgi:hypothetical protein
MLRGVLGAKVPPGPTHPCVEVVGFELSAGGVTTPAAALLATSRPTALTRGPFAERTYGRSYRWSP